MIGLPCDGDVFTDDKLNKICLAPVAVMHNVDMVLLSLLKIVHVNQTLCIEKLNTRFTGLFLGARRSKHGVLKDFKEELCKIFYP